MGGREGGRDGERKGVRERVGGAGVRETREQTYIKYVPLIRNQTHSSAHGLTL